MKIRLFQSLNHEEVDLQMQFLIKSCYYHRGSIITRSWLQTAHEYWPYISRDRIFWKNLLVNKEMVFKNGVKIYKPRIIMERVR